MAWSPKLTLKTFQIPYMVIHDEDPLPDPIPTDWDEQKLKSRRSLFQLNSEIKRDVEAPLGVLEVLSPDFEGVAGVSKTQADRKGKALAGLEHLGRLETKDIPKRLVDVVRLAYGSAAP